MPRLRRTPVPPAPELNPWTGRPVGESIPIVSEEREAASAAGQAAYATRRDPRPAYVGFSPSGGTRPSEGMYAFWERKEREAAEADA